MVGNGATVRKKFSQKSALILLSFALLLIFLAAPKPYCVSESAEAAGQGYALIEVTTGRLLKASNQNARLPMASTTKAMTALVVLENTDLSDTVVIPKQAVGIEGSSIYLKEGEKFTVEELLYGLMLRSGNDAAVALAVHVSGSVDKFVAKMNEKAAEMGLKDTSFINPHGLHDENHYTTAYELALIAAEGLKNPEFKKIVSTKNIKCEGEWHETRYFANKNKILYNYEGATGVKTGFTKNSGRCLIASAEREGMEVVAVALNYYDYFELTAHLMDYAFENYSMNRVISPDYVYKTVPVSGNRKIKSADLKVKNACYYPMKKDGSESVETVVEGVDSIKAPHSANDQVGSVKVFKDNRLIFEEKLYTIDIEKKGIFSIFGK